MLLQPDIYAFTAWHLCFHKAISMPLQRISNAFAMRNARFLSPKALPLYRSKQYITNTQQVSIQAIIPVFACSPVFIFKYPTLVCRARSKV